MAKGRIDTGETGQGVHTRTTGGPEESQVVVLGIDGSDNVAPTDATEGLKVNSNAVGTTADASSASTVVGRLKKLVELLTTTASSFLAVRLTDGASYLGTVADRLKVDVGGSLPAGTNNIGDVDVLTLPVPDQVGTLTDGRKTVTAAGTAEAIRGSLACKWVTVTALTSNTLQVNVGGSGVLATAGGSTGTPLFAGGSITIPISNANLVFVDARQSGEGVSFTVGT